ncbi:MAG: hypothetical protein JSR46_09650 [Verrucomicrobia bacterium]|nr:hypothetical protein [Verrucomicrobiota bacterium]
MGKRRSPKVRGKKTVRSERFSGVDNTDDLDIVLTGNKIFSDILGFSDDELMPLYDHAIQMLYAQRIEDAKTAFSFLTKINPYLAIFWVGLGLAHTAEGNISAAFTAFLMALTMDPLMIEAYEYAIDCCIEKEDFKQAESLVKQLAGAVKHCTSSAEVKVIQHQIKILEDKIALKKP